MDNQKITKENIDSKLCDICNKEIFGKAINYKNALQTWIYMKNNSYKFNVKQAQEHIIKIKKLRNQLKPLDYKNEIIPLIEGIFPPAL